MMKSVISAAGLVAAVSAYTQPAAQTYGSLLNPDVNHPVTTGQDFTVTWSPNQPATGVTVSLVLCNGPSTNCVLQSSAIAEGISAAAGSYTWSVPCSLPAGVQNTATGYGMLIIVDGTGEFQYSTQFSVNQGASCSSSSSTTTTSSVSASSSSSSSVSSSATSSSAIISTTSKSQSSSGTTSVSGQPSSSTISGGWYGWSSSGFNTTTTPAGTASSGLVTASSVKTTSASASYIKPSSSSAAATTSAKPSAFTGAAAMPSAFVNAAGFVGAAALAMFAL